MTILTSSWQLWALLAALFAAATAILAKLGVDPIAPDLATLIRTVVVGVLLTGLVVATGQGKDLGSIAPRSWLFLTLSGIATGASWLCYFRALKLGPASQVAPIDKLSVVFVAFLGVAVLGERLSPTAWAGIGLITLGAVLVAVGN